MVGLRRRVGEVLRAKVAGADAAHRHWDTYEKPGPRWFTPADPIWQVHNDAAMYCSGITALLTQSLHPLAMAGVLGHSGYRSDPWGRLQRTSDYIGRTTFGTIPDAESTIARVRAVHDRVRGTAPDGRPYRASDPHLLLWVHVAEIDSFLRGYQALSGRLSATAADQYVAQCAEIAERLGVVAPPRSVEALDAALDDFRSELVPSDAARDVARFLLREPPLPVWARPGFGLLARGGITLLHPWARELLRLSDPVAGLVAGKAGVGAVRWALAGLG